MTKHGAIWLVSAAACLATLCGCGESSKNGSTANQAGQASGGAGTTGGQSSSGSAAVGGGSSGSASGGKSAADCVDSQGHTPGSFDTSFGTDGTALLTIDPKVDLKTDPDIVADAALAANGDVVVVAQHGLGCTLFRVDKDGKPVATFGTQGRVDLTFKLFGYCKTVTIDGQGRLLIAGSENQNGAVSRYTPDGAPDTTFGDQGHAQIDLGTLNDLLLGLVVRADQSIAAVGTSDTNGPTPGNKLVLLSADGAPASGTPVALDPGAGRQFPVGLAELPDHHLLIVGENQTAGSAYLLQVDADGAPVMTFGDAGWMHSADKSFLNVSGLLATADNPTAWGYTGGNKVALMDIDGKYAVFAKDSSVGPMGIAQQCDGKLLVSGEDINANGAIGRLASDGSLDSDFTLQSWPKGDYFSQADRVLLQPDGNIVVAGNAAGKPFVARLWP